jgi:hypothetical protein
MQILVHTDHTITGSEKRSAEISSVIESALDRFSNHVTRVEVHVSDQNSRKGGVDDIRCVMEAHLAGRSPVAITHKSRLLDTAVADAAVKLARLIEHTFDRLHDSRKSLKG